MRGRGLIMAALALATGDHKNAEIEQLLVNAGAVAPAHVDAAVLQNYVGKYKNDEGTEINVTFNDDKLFAGPGTQEPLCLYAVDRTSFRPIEFDDFGTLKFIVEDHKVIGCALIHGTHETKFNKC